MSLKRQESRKLEHSGPEKARRSEMRELCKEGVR